MKFYTIAVITVLFVALTAFITINAEGINKPQEGVGINWMTFEQAVKLNAKKPKKMIIDVYTDWCGWCKVMDKQTFSDPIIIEYVNANYYAVKLNAEMTDKLTFQGADYEFVVTNPANNKGYHAFAAKLLDGKLSYPSTVVLDEQYGRIGLVPGFLRPEQFDQMLKYYGGNHNKTTPYEEFTKNYKSPYGQ
jgi:thioredoxin-related protein